MQTEITYEKLGAMAINDAKHRLYEWFTYEKPLKGDTPRKKVDRIRFHLRKAGFSAEAVEVATA